MEQFIGCDAHKKFSVFVAVNEKGQAGEALRVAHDRQLYREFLGRLPPHPSRGKKPIVIQLVGRAERGGSGPRPQFSPPPTHTPRAGG